MPRPDRLRRSPWAAAAPAAEAKRRSRCARRAVAARLRVTADFAPRRTTVAFRGTRAGAASWRRARRDPVRRRSLRALRAARALRCGGSRAAPPALAPAAGRAVAVRARRGARAPARRGARHAAAADPTALPSSRRPPPLAPAPAPFSTTPPLLPAYDPAIPDYTVACEPARSVRVVDDGGERTLAALRGRVVHFHGRRPPPPRALPAADVDGLDGHARRHAAVRVDRLQHRRPATPSSPTTTACRCGGVRALRRFRTAASCRDGSVAVGRVTEGSWGRAPYERVALDGTPLGALDTVGSSADPHELQILPNGNALMHALRAARRRRPLEPRRPARRHGARRRDPGGHARPRARVVVEQRRPHRRPARRRSRSRRSGRWSTAQLAYDLVHLNSLQADGDGVLLSARNLNAVYRIRRDGSVDWKLGGTRAGGEPRLPRRAVRRRRPRRPASGRAAARRHDHAARQRDAARAARRARCASPSTRSRAPRPWSSAWSTRGSRPRSAAAARPGSPAATGSSPGASRR